MQDSNLALNRRHNVRWRTSTTCNSTLTYGWSWRTSTYHRLKPLCYIRYSIALKRNKTQWTSFYYSHCEGQNHKIYLPLTMCLPPESDVELVGTETLDGVVILTTLLPIIARNIHNKYNIVHPMGRGLCAFNMYFVLYRGLTVCKCYVGRNERVIRQIFLLRFQPFWNFTNLTLIFILLVSW